jgi:hypothetical protein
MSETERIWQLEEAIKQTGVGMMVNTALDDGHDWVTHADNPSLDPVIAWCQWCGVHRVEIAEWVNDPPCPAFVAIRIAMYTRTPEE